MPTTLSNLPQNQIAALPVIGGTGGSVIVVGGVPTRKWTSLQTGINTVATTTDANGHVFCVTGFLDVTGCRSFMGLILRSSAGAALGAPPAMTVWFQPRINDTDVPPTSLAPGIQLTFCGMSQCGPNIGLPAMAAAAEVQRALMCWDFSEVTGAAGVVGSMSDGVRFFLSFATNAVNADNRFNLTLWGSG